jgi:CubicO group peptidase (beta-lactamase class C family)
MKISLCILLMICLNGTHAQDLDSLLNDHRKKNKIPMLAVAAIKSDTILYMKAFGQRRLEDTHDNATINDYIYLASNTKAMTGFLAAKLVESGKIRWDTKFFDLFSEWKKKANPAFHNITLQELLSHRARVPAYTNLKEFAPAVSALGNVKGSVSAKRKAFVEFILQREPATPKDSSGTVYSNAGYAAAALMLEKATKKTWEQLMTQVYKNDLGFNIFFGFPHEVSSAQPHGYSDSLTLIPAVYEGIPLKPNQYTEPAGTVSMPFNEYVKFIQMNLKGLKEDGHYLKKSTYEFLHFGFPGEAIGWGNGIQGGAKLSNHTGSNGHFFIGAAISPEKDIAYVVIVNTGNGKAAFGALQTLMKKFN